MAKGDQDLLTLVNAAEIADRDPSTMRRAIERGVLVAEKYGKTWLVKRKDLKAWMRSDAYDENKRRK